MDINSYIPMRNLVLFLSYGIALSFFSCTSHLQSSNGIGKQTPSNVVEPTQQNFPLYAYLRKVPGVQVSVQGQDNVRVLVRGGSSISLENDPLFVIDNVPVGNSYAQAANMIDVNDIQYVSVLKDPSETSIYGFRGSNGIIMIKTKKN